MHLTASVQIGTPNMVKNNIMARVVVNIHPEEGKDPVFEINNITIRKKDDELWVAMPAEQFTIQTPEGEKKRWKTLVRVGPKEKRGDDQKTPIQDKFNAFLMKRYREALEAAKVEQKAQEPVPAKAPADEGEPEF
jgi:hypothetical protein